MEDLFNLPVGNRMGADPKLIVLVAFLLKKRSYMLLVSIFACLGLTYLLSSGLYVSA